MKRVLVVTYGGGHVAAMIPLLKRLKNNQKFYLEIIGLTTAKKKLINDGFNCKGSSDLFSLKQDKLLKIVKSGKLELSDQIIKLVYLDDNKITVFFDKKTLDLKGWQIIDQYNNNINFSLNIVAKNDVFKKGTFKIPEMN